MPTLTPQQQKTLLEWRPDLRNHTDDLSRILETTPKQLFINLLNAITNYQLLKNHCIINIIHANNDTNTIIINFQKLSKNLEKILRNIFDEVFTRNLANITKLDENGRAYAKKFIGEFINKDPMNIKAIFHLYHLIIKNVGRQITLETVQNIVASFSPNVLNLFTAAYGKSRFFRADIREHLMQFLTTNHKNETLLNELVKLIDASEADFEYWVMQHIKPVRLTPYATANFTTTLQGKQIEQSASKIATAATKHEETTPHNKENQLPLPPNNRLC